jgi:hypothetical protein
MDVLLFYVGVVVLWPFLVLVFDVVSKISASRLKKKMETIADNAVFAGISMVFGSVYFWLGSATTYDWKITVGGFILVVVGFVLSSLIEKFFEDKA